MSDLPRPEVLVRVRAMRVRSGPRPPLSEAQLAVLLATFGPKLVPARSTDRTPSTVPAAFGEGAQTEGM